MPEEIISGLYCLEIPLPNNPLKTINSYIIKTTDRNLIIDTGLNCRACYEIFAKGLAELAVDLSRTDFFVTHMHADHSGLVPEFAGQNSAVYVSAHDASTISGLVSGYKYWESIEHYACLNGMPEDLAHEAIQNHPGFKFGPKAEPNYTIIKERDVISIGDYNLMCIETPGHTKGHVCLYDKGKKLLFSGDHILGDITPNISLWTDEENPLEDYLKSLSKITALNVELVLPGHRHLFSDCDGRINFLVEHHRHRIEEILSLLALNCLTAFDLAARINWNISRNSFKELPPAQKWFATGETIANLKYLETQGIVQKGRWGNQTVYWR